jgi:hypothetical protein
LRMKEGPKTLWVKWRQGDFMDESISSSAQYVTHPPKMFFTALHPKF